MLRVMSIAAALAACSGRAPGPAAPPAPAAAPSAPAAPLHADIGAPSADAGAPLAPPADAALLDQDLPRLVERDLALYRDVARALAASGQDCAAASARLRELSGRYRDAVIANARVLHDGRARQLRAALDLHGDEFDAAAQAVVQSPTMARCGQDPAFGKAYDELRAPP